MPKVAAHLPGNNDHGRFIDTGEQQQQQQQQEDQLQQQNEQGDGDEQAPFSQKLQGGEEEEEDATTATDRSIHGSTSDADCPETEAISMAFQLHSLTECTSCSEDNLSHYDDYNSEQLEDDDEEEEQYQDCQSGNDSIDKGHKVKTASGHRANRPPHHQHPHQQQQRRRRRRIRRRPRDARGESDLENADIEKEAEKYRVIEELELDKYELENKSQPWLLSALHQLAGGNLLFPPGGSGCGENRISKKGSSQNTCGVNFTSNVPLEYQCNSSGQCKLCNLLCPKADASWDLLDTETVTLMDVLERLSRILAQKAKQLISSKRKRKQGPCEGGGGGGGGEGEGESEGKSKGEERGGDKMEKTGGEGTTGPGREKRMQLASGEGKDHRERRKREEEQDEDEDEDEDEEEKEDQVQGGRKGEQPAAAITNEQGGGRKGKCDSQEPVGRKKRINPLKDLKDSGIAVKKVENRKRLIILKDGATQYWIQGKVSLAHPSFAQSTFLSFLLLLVSRHTHTHT